MRDLRSPFKKAQGLGSARSGTHHFMAQRITAVALIPITLWLMTLVPYLLHADYVTAYAMFVKPWNTIIFAAFFILAFWHAQLGLQVIIEDYVHHRLAALLLQLATKLGAFFCVLIILFIIVSLSLGGSVE